MDDFSRDFEAVTAELSGTIRGFIRGGMTPRRAALKAYKQLGIPDEMEKLTLDGVTTVIAGASASIVMSADPQFREWFLHHHFQKDKLNLSKRIADTAWIEDIGDNLAASMKRSGNWIKTARNLNKADLVKADVAGYIQDVDRAARRVMAGDQQAISAYKKSLRKAKRQIERLAKDGAPTTRLKKAHQAIIKAAEGKSVEALNKAMDREIRAKAAYNADRIARTEIARAYSQGTYTRILDDEDAVGVRSVLASRHPEADICNFWAEADLYGMGRGVYPTSAAPPYPYHPNEICNLETVYRGEKQDGQMDAGANKYIEKLSEKNQKLLMGVKGRKNWMKNKKGWRNHVKNYNAPQSMKSQVEIPKKYMEA